MTAVLQSHQVRNKWKMIEDNNALRPGGGETRQWDGPIYQSTWELKVFVKMPGLPQETRLQHEDESNGSTM